MSKYLSLASAIGSKIQNMTNSQQRYFALGIILILLLTLWLCHKPVVSIAAKSRFKRRKSSPSSTRWRNWLKMAGINAATLAASDDLAHGRPKYKTADQFNSER